MSSFENRKVTDDYEVIDVLGRGGFSVVRRGVGKNKEDRRHVAIKTLKRLGFTPQGINRCQVAQKPPTMKQVSISDALLTNEILVMRKIVEDVSPHPNVIHLYDVYEDMHGVHLVLELCSGGELFDRIIAQWRYSEVEAAEVVRQIACGLGALHRASIVHRDLKPENCLFLNSSERSPLKIMDFGLSSVEDFTDPIVALFGSIDYVSPEALSQRQVSSASDMWSLGVILYILLSGCPPFHAISNKDKQQRILAGDFTFEEHTWKTITSSAKDLISSLLAVEPYRRPTAEDLLKHPWVIGDCAKQELIDAEVVSRLQSFNALRKFRAAALASVWSSKVFLRTKKLRNLLGSHDLTPDELENLRMHFKRICSNGDNATLEEFEQVLKAINMDSLIPLASRVFDIFDNNRDGTVDMREILCGLSSLRNSRGDDALRLCFQMYDADRSGCISREELASMLRALPEDCLPADITEPGKLDEIFDQMDANSDGKVSFEEFKAAMQRDSSLQDVLSSLRLIIRKVSKEKLSEEDMQKLFPVDLSADLQKALILQLRKYQNQWEKEVAGEQPLLERTMALFSDITTTPTSFVPSQFSNFFPWMRQCSTRLDTFGFDNWHTKLRAGDLDLQHEASTKNFRDNSSFDNLATLPRLKSMIWSMEQSSPLQLNSHSIVTLKASIQHISLIFLCKLFCRIHKLHFLLDSKYNTQQNAL